MGAEVDFNSLQFEKKLSNLKDSQDSINAACIWCLDHKQYHKRIVATWLSVLKRVKVDQRLTLFYLANDVIQYSKRKNYDFVDSWGTALQKATPLVRDAKVKHKILRIFKIWEQRGVYGEEFITDLSGLISVSPSAKKIDENHEFQSSHLVSKIRTCAKLESETDRKLQLFKQHNPKLQDGEALMGSLKDRAHVDDVEKEMDDYINHMEGYMDALKMEIKARNSLINLLNTADTQLEKDRKDVKVVAVAYKSFATRVKNLKKKLEEKKTSLNSPIPSPDVNAPSPSPDSDLDLPDNATPVHNANSIVKPETYPNAGFYNQTSLQSANDQAQSFMNNGFSSFIGSGMTFNLHSLNDTNGGKSLNSLSNLFPGIADPPPPPAPAPVPAPASNYNNYNNNQMPLAPPPLPPFTNEVYGDYSSGNNYGNGSYNDQMADPYQSYNNTYNPSGVDYNNAPPPPGGPQNYDPYKCDEYSPEEDVETWENNEWEQPPSGLETPASPPPIEKEGFLAPIEYHEGQSIPGAVDVDHRLLLGMNNNSDKKDIDHRNLISLTGSPKDDNAHETKEVPNEWHSEAHVFPRRSKDFRNRPSIQQQQQQTTHTSHPHSHHPTHISHNSDNNESIDMDLSDDDAASNNTQNDDNHIKPPKKGLLPPPPFPADLEANNFLDGLNDPTYDEYEQDVLALDGGGGQQWRRPDDKWMGALPAGPGGGVLGGPGNMMMGPNALPRHARPPNNQQLDADMVGRMGMGRRGNRMNGGRGEFNNRGDFRENNNNGRGRFRGGAGGKFLRGGWGQAPGGPPGGVRGGMRGRGAPRFAGNFRPNPNY